MIGFYIGKRYFNNYVENDKFEGKIVLQWVLVVFMALMFYKMFPFFHYKNSNFMNHLNSLFVNINLSIFGVATMFLFLYLSKGLNRLNRISLLNHLDSLTIYIFLLNQVYMVGATNITVVTDNLGVQIMLVYVLTITTAVILWLSQKLVIKYRPATI